MQIEEQKYRIMEMAAEAGFTLSDLQMNQFLEFYDELIEKNKVMNLTAITEFEDVLVKHFADSISLSRVAPLTDQDTLADLGTGAGFPGIPLKIVYPGTRMVLIDSLQKRLRFLEDVIRKCSLTDITCVHSRAEDIGHSKQYREAFDYCVSRAVANLSTLCEYCLPLVKKDGCFAAYKSGDVQEEIKQASKAISILGGEVEKIDSFVLGKEEYGRTLILIRKRKETPGKYPRKAGIPSREPL